MKELNNMNSYIKTRDNTIVKIGINEEYGCMKIGSRVSGDGKGTETIFVRSWKSEHTGEAGNKNPL